MNKFRIALGAMALVMVVVAVTSCNKERDLKYSCNPKINRWVLKNVESIAAASRQQLAVLPLDFQKASYLTLSPERKYELWNEKLELVKANWDEPVQNMIVDLQNCNVTSSGCGLLYMYECKGHCENEIVVVEVD